MRLRTSARLIRMYSGCPIKGMQAQDLVVHVLQPHGRVMTWQLVDARNVGAHAPWETPHVMQVMGSARNSILTSPAHVGSLTRSLRMVVPVWLGGNLHASAGDLHGL